MIQLGLPLVAWLAVEAAVETNVAVRSRVHPRTFGSTQLVLQTAVHYSSQMRQTCSPMQPPTWQVDLTLWEVAVVLAAAVAVVSVMVAFVQLAALAVVVFAVFVGGRFVLEEVELLAGAVALVGSGLAVVVVVVVVLLA